MHPLLRTGPVLRALGLSTPPTGRDEALRLFDLSAEDVALNAYVKLMGQPRFSQIDFSIVEAHVPFLKRTSVDAKEEEIQSEKERVRLTLEKSIFSSLMLPSASSDSDLFFDSSRTIVEMRQLFLEFLSEAYEHLIAIGELDDRGHGGFNADTLKQSVVFALSAAKERPLNDFKYTNMFPYHREIWRHSKLILNRLWHRQKLEISNIVAHDKTNYAVQRALCFIEGHRIAEAKLEIYVSRAELEMMDSGRWDAVFADLKTVIGESHAQVAKAESIISAVEDEELSPILSHFVATILIKQLIQYVESQADDNVLSSKEAHEYLDKLEKELLRNQAYRVPGSKKEYDYKTGKENICFSEGVRTDMIDED